MPPPGTFATKSDLQTAVWEYDANSTAAIATYGPATDWDVSAITDMSWLFYNTASFNADIADWDTSSVTDMSGMFASASAFNQPLSLDTSSVTSMNSMFSSEKAPFGAGACGQSALNLYCI